MGNADGYLKAGELLLELRTDYAAARDRFEWPRPEEFNWALDFFDVTPKGERDALILLEDDGSSTRATFDEMRARSNQVANMLRDLGIKRGDRILLMLGNEIPLWETMLAAIKLGAVLIPSSTLLHPDDIADRIERGEVRAIVADSPLHDRFPAGDLIRVSVGEDVEGWTPFSSASSATSAFEPDGPTKADDLLLLYFTSGTTSKPKLVAHTHTTYPIGHLTTMFVLGLMPGDVHLNISSPGWAKHAWSSFFGPWIADATILSYNFTRFDAPALLKVLQSNHVTTFCAPPTVWRQLVQQDLASATTDLREVLSAGEPLNAEIIDQVERAWGLTVRDFYGQTETTLLCGNTPGQKVKAGSMGRVGPGYDVVLLDADGNEADDGEICVRFEPERPKGLMIGYLDDPDRTAEVMRDGFYHTGDSASRDEEGYITYVGRTDDVFKASDYRISPFELESILVEHEAVAEAAVVPSPDQRRFAVPKAFVIVAAGHEPTAETARSILAHCKDRLAPYKRIRRLEFSDLPKTISGKIRRVELRAAEMKRDDANLVRRDNEHWEEDFV